MHDTSAGTGPDSATTDDLHGRLQAGRPEFGDALEGLRARMLAVAGGLAPRTIGRYRLGRVIGTGAFGTVHEAEDPELDRRVAIKLLAVRSPKEAARVVREAQLLATLSHPNVVQVFEVGTTDGGRSPYVVMELVEGPTLRQWLSQGPHPWRAVIEVMLPVAQGLWAAHQAGIIHRDLKPENVLMGRDGRPRVIDFGLARALGDEGEGSGSGTLRSGTSASASVSGSASGSRPGVEASPQLTATGQVMGTPAYMAPEVFAGEYTPQGDQYALCVTLHEALFGARPFAAASAQELVEQVLAHEVRRPAGRRGVPRHVAAIVLRGLRRAPRERFGDLGQLVAALERAGRPRGRGWVVGALAGAGGLVAAGAIIVTSPEPRPAETIAQDHAAPQDPAVDPAQALGVVGELSVAAERLRTLLAAAMLAAATTESATLLERADALAHGPSRVEAWLLRGQALMLATDYEHAMPTLEQAYLLAQQEGMPREAAHAASELVGVLGYVADQYENAHRWKDHADGAFERAGLDPRQHVPYVLAVAGLMSREGERAGAIAMLREAVGAVERDERARTFVHAQLLERLAQELGAEESPQGVEAALVPAREAAAIFAEHHGPRSPTHALAVDRIGVLLTRLGRHDEALPYNQQALEIREAILPAGHIDLARSHGNMGMVLGKLGRHDEAFEHLQRTIELFTARLGPESSGVAEAHSIRASIHESRGPAGRDDALRDYERAARIFDVAGVIYTHKAQLARDAIVRLGGTPPPVPSIPIPP
jgi:tetratricopeptide (TPR) repeat protein